MPISEQSGISIFYECAGEGHPFVFIHANPTDHNMWLYQTARFSKNFCTIAMDLRGYGRSGKPEIAYSFQDVADDILGVCRAEDITRTILAGTGHGRYLLDTLLDRTPALSGEAIARLFEAFDGVDLYSRVAEIETPVLIVNGEHDMSLPGARETADRLPDAVHRIIPNAEHPCCFEAPAAFDAMVVEFLQTRGLMPDSVS